MEGWKEVGVVGDELHVVVGGVASARALVLVLVPLFLRVCVVRQVGRRGDRPRGARRFQQRPELEVGVIMTRCLLCGFDSKGKTGHGQVSCDLRKLPCRRTLPAGNPFKRHITQCTDLACVCRQKCPSCDIMGHSNRTLAVSGTHYRSGTGGSILRKESAPPLRGADYVCGLIHDAEAEGFRVAAVAHYKKKLDESARLAGAAEELVGNASQSGMNPAASLARMEEMGMKAATLDPSNRAHFDESSRLLEDPNVSAVDAALGACGVFVGSTRPSAVGPVAATGPTGPVVGAPSAHGVAAAVRAAARAAPSATAATAANAEQPVGQQAMPRSRGGQTSRGSSLVSAQTLFGANNLSMAQAGIDTARRLSLTGSVSTRPASRAANATTGTGSGTRSFEVAASPFAWPPGERQRFEESLGAFEQPSLSVMTSEELAVAAHKGSLGDTMASKLPEVKADFIDGARNNMLLGVMLTCGVVTPARFAEQLCSSRLQKPHTNLLMMLAVWMVKIHKEAELSAPKEGRPRKRSRSGDIVGGSGCVSGSGGDDSPDGEGPFDVDEGPPHV